MITPKETQALQRLKDTLLAEGYWQDVLQDVAIIENALNEYYRLLKEDDEMTKKIKALEIILKKKVNVYDEIYQTNDYEDYKENFGYTQAQFDLTEEEYNLLKEVLCE